MKKIKSLLVCFLAVAVLAGCSGDTTKKTTVCKGMVQGTEEVITLKGEGDNLLELVEEASIPLSMSGVSVEDYEKDNSILDFDLFNDYMMDAYFGKDKVDGVKIDSKVEGENIVVKLSVDFTKADMDALEESGYIESGLLKSLSYEKSVENYKKNLGLTCSEE